MPRAGSADASEPSWADALGRMWRMPRAVRRSHIGSAAAVFTSSNSCRFACALMRRAPAIGALYAL